MDWKQVVADLMAANVKQTEIAEFCGVRQGSVSDLLNGNTQEPRWGFGKRLLELHAQRVGVGQGSSSPVQGTDTERAA